MFKAKPPPGLSVSQGLSRFWHQRAFSTHGHWMVSDAPARPLSRPSPAATAVLTACAQCTPGSLWSPEGRVTPSAPTSPSPHPEPAVGGPAAPQAGWPAAVWGSPLPSFLSQALPGLSLRPPLPAFGQAEVCAKNNPKTAAGHPQVGTQYRGAGPTEDWQMDFTQMLQTAGNFRYLLVFVDTFSFLIFGCTT